MSAFEFSFTFYGLVLGLAVVELVAGVGRLVHDGHRIRIGWLTPTLAGFLALDVATFWNQAWAMNQHAPFSITLLILGLISAGLFYLAATLVFPREIEEGQDLTVHYWRHRRLVIALVGAANLTNASWHAALTLAVAPENFWPGVAWVGGFFLLTLGAAFLPRGRVAVACLILLIANNVWYVLHDAGALLSNGPWEVVYGLPGEAPAP